MRHYDDRPEVAGTGSVRCSYMPPWGHRCGRYTRTGERCNLHAVGRVSTAVMTARRQERRLRWMRAVERGLTIRSILSLYDWWDEPGGPGREG